MRLSFQSGGLPLRIWFLTEMNMRRVNRWSVLVVGFLAVGVAAVLIQIKGCATQPRLSGNLHSTPDRSRKLMNLAAEEASAIPEVDARLTRQLNFADQQINRGWPDDARVTLAAARATLASPDAAKLNDHARLSGWISVSELSRGVQDMAGAEKACAGALAAMNAIDDPAIRCEYVMGIANEQQYLEGKDVAGKTLVAAGPWTKSIDDVTRRRSAVVSFASALFNLDDFGGGQAMLRNEDDPAWRSDILLRMASAPTYDSRQMNQADAPAALSASMSKANELKLHADALQGSAPYFGKSLRYRDVFQGQQNSQTAK